MLSKLSLKREHRPFFRLMISYFAMVFIIILFGSIAYKKTVIMVETDTKESFSAVLEQCKNTLDARFKEIENITIQLSKDSDIRDFMNLQRPFKDPDYYKIQKIFNKMYPYRLANTFMDRIFIYFKNSDVIISSHHASIRVPLYYENFLKYEGINYDEWNNKLYLNEKNYWPSHRVLIGDEIKSFVTFVKPILVENQLMRGGVFIALVNEKKILDHLKFLDLVNDGWCYIVDKEDNIIASTYKGSIPKIDITEYRGHFEDMIDGNRMFIIYDTSEYNGWKYVMVVPINAIMEKVSYYNRFYFTILVTVLTIGITVAGILAYKNSRPISALIRKMKEWMDNNDLYDGGNEYDFVENSITNIIKNNNRLKKEMKKQSELMVTAFFERLFRGGFNSIQEIESVLTGTDLKINSDIYSVIIFQIDEYDINSKVKRVFDKSDVTRMLIANFLKEQLNGIGYIHTIDNERIAALLLLQCDKDSMYVKDLARKLVHAVNKSFYVNILFGVGNMYTSLLDVSQSFNEANQVLEYNMLKPKNKVLCFSEIPIVQIGFYYPVDLELKLINLVKTGQVDEVMDILNTIYRKNFVQTILPLYMSKQLLYAIYCTIIRLKNEILLENNEECVELEQAIENTIFNVPIDIIYENMINIFKYYCSVVNRRKNDYNKRLANKILDYLKSNYSNPSLSLLSVASRFNFTEKNLSYFFKEQVGENFSSYLERIRLENACEMLLNDDKTIEEIARDVGYYSSNTFYKAFKRVYGVSPCDYKFMYNKKELESRFYLGV
ncbi:MAG: AraC family transcriptional regulator [Clostridiales bacterium]|nr:AraC family transcriptional regulator [Clostridiales bacterium]